MRVVSQTRFESLPESAVGEASLVVHQKEGDGDRDLVVLIHGLGGHRYRTWHLLPQFLFEDLAGCAIGLYGYTSGLRRIRRPRTSVEIADHARELAATLRDSRFERIVLVGHSMGGLLAKAVIAHLVETGSTTDQLGSTVRRITGLFLLAAPQAGARGVFGYFGSRADRRALKLFGPFVTRLAELFSDRISVDLRDVYTHRIGLPTFCAGATRDRWVTRLSAEMGVPSDQKKLVRGTHTSFAKPQSREADLYPWLLRHIQLRLDSGAQFDRTDSLLRTGDTPDTTSGQRSAPAFNLPLDRNADFVGRDDALDALQRSPQATAITNGQALTGLGGVGKTQLALEFAYAGLESNIFELVWWLRAEDPQVLVADLADLGEHLGLANSDMERPDAARAALRHLNASSPRWLLIYDNASGPIEVRPWLARGPNGRVVITTRSRGTWAGLASELNVEVFDTETAVAFLLRKTGRNDPHRARLLADRLGGHALALKQAAAYLNETGRSFSDYLRLLNDERSARLLSRPAGEADYEATMTTVVAQSRAAAELRSPMAGRLLEFLSFLDPDKIPRRLLERAQSALGFDGDVLDDAIAALRAFSVVDVAEGRLSIHRLVQEIVRRDAAPASAVAVVDLLTERFPSDASRPQVWETCSELLPHVLQVAQVCDEPETELRIAKLLDRLASYVQHRGDAQGATESYRLALATTRRLLGEEHPETLDKMKNLAGAWLAQNDLVKARQLYDSALDTSRRVLGEDSRIALACLTGLSSTLAAQGDAAAAQAMQEEHLAISIRAFGPDDRQTALSMNNLAVKLFAGGDFARARELQESAIGALRRSVGDSHPLTLVAMANLAGTLQAQGDLRGALTLARSVAATRGTLLGEDHPDTLTAIARVSSLLRSQGDFDEARTLDETVLEGRRLVLGAEHPDTLSALSEVATTLLESGELDAARQLSEAALAAHRRVSGDEHPATLQAGMLHARILERSGEGEAARTLRSAILEIQRRTIGEEHPDTVATQSALATSRYYAGDLEGALVETETVLHLRRKLWGDSHPSTLKTKSNMAVFLAAAGEFDRALLLEMEVLDDNVRALGKDHPHTITSMGRAGRTLAALKRFDEARTLQEAVFHEHLRTLGPGHTSTLQSKSDLAATLRAIGDLQAARSIEDPEVGNGTAG